MTSTVPDDRIVFFYRFAPVEDRTYGPKPFGWIKDVYGSRQELECAPATVEGEPPDWRSFEEWDTIIVPSPASERQLARLRNLEIGFSDDISYLRAAALIAEADGRKPPTPALVKQAKSLRISIPAGVTRAELGDLIAAAERARQIAALVAHGWISREDASDDNLFEAEDAYDSMLDGVSDAKEHGLNASPLTSWTVEEAKAFAAALDRFCSVAEDSEWIFKEMREEGRIDRVPQRSAVRAVFPQLLELIRSGEWAAHGGSFLVLAELAFAHQQSEGKAL